MTIHRRLTTLNYDDYMFISFFQGLNIVCDIEPNTCDVTLPTLAAEEQYILESFEHSLSSEAKAARFLEQATFGATKEDIAALVANNLNFEDWIAQQYALPATSLRSFYRKRVNAKIEFPYYHSTLGPRPCQIYSRWRTYAITSRDMLENRKTIWSKFLTIEMDESGRYIWKVDGMFRTYTNEAPVDSTGAPLLIGARYAIENNGRSWKADCVGKYDRDLIPESDHECFR